MMSQNSASTSANEVPPGASQGLADTPKTALEAPEADSNAPEANMDNPEAVADSPEAIISSEEGVMESPEAVMIAPEAVIGIPEAIIAAPTAPDAAVENPALAVAFSPAPDAPFQSSLALSLSCARPSARIHYALGAGDVGEEGLIFDPKDKILLTQNTLVAARAFENGERGPLFVGTFEVRKPLWQEVEPADMSDAVPHKIGENGLCEDGWKVSAGSVRGKLHAHRGLWREDSFGFGQAWQNGLGAWQIAAVSDGAGSAALSRIGSRIACEAAIADLQVSLATLPAFSGARSELETRDLPLLRDALTKSASAALEAIRVEAARRNESLGAFATTLLVLVRREWNGAQLCASLQVGDGIVALCDESGLTLLGVADHGQHSSETRFLTTKGIEAELAARVSFSIKDSLCAFAILSDGVSDDYFPEEKRLGEVFDAVTPLLEAAEDGGAALISWLGYEKKGSSDDRTILVGWRGGE